MGKDRNEPKSVSYTHLWLEIPFGGQTILSLDTQTIEKYLDKLEAKTTVGELLAEMCIRDRL